MNELVITPEEERRGMLYASAAYVMWGVMPLFWALLNTVPPLEVALHRVLWCALAVGAMTLWRGRSRIFLEIVKTPRLIGALALSSVLISMNWGIFLYAVQAHRVVEASFGYFITPLLSMGLGMVMLGERVSVVRLAAMALGILAMAFQASEIGHVPWIALILAVSFALYGFIRKKTPVDALDGLTVETLVLFPLTAILIGTWAIDGSGAFVSAGALVSLLLVLGGPLTALPLVLFASGARRVRMTTMGFLQYLSPSITLIVAVLLMGESFTQTDTLTFGLIWTALLLVALENPITRALRALAQPS